MLDQLQSFLENAKPALSVMAQDIVEIDHVCIRAKTMEEYEVFKSSFDGHLLAESPVNGRLISTIKLSQPIWLGDYCIDLVEIPQPNGKYETGWEHLEVVTDQRDKYSKLKGKDFNIKFHYQSLENIIHIENHSLLSQILEIMTSEFSDCNPLASGTLPIDIATKDSDADILLFSTNFCQLADRLAKKFSAHEDFSVSESESRVGPCLLCRFNFSGLPVEIFAQECDPLKQHAHQHFLVENRLLKLFGSNFRQRILDRKNAGEKTEPAFTAELGLSPSVDAYLELLKFRNLTDREIYDKYAGVIFSSKPSPKDPEKIWSQ